MPWASGFFLARASLPRLPRSRSLTCSQPASSQALVLIPSGLTRALSARFSV